MPVKYSWMWMSVDQLAQRIAYKAGTDFEEYIGEAWPQNQHRTGDRKWRIKKITYDGTNRIVSILWAERSMEFNFAWDLRATYSYA